MENFKIKANTDSSYFFFLKLLHVKKKKSETWKAISNGLFVLGVFIEVQSYVVDLRIGECEGILPWFSLLWYDPHLHVFLFFKFFINARIIACRFLAKWATLPQNTVWSDGTKSNKRTQSLNILDLQSTFITGTTQYIKIQ